MKTVPGVTGEAQPAGTRLAETRLTVIRLAVIRLAVIRLAVIELAAVVQAVERAIKRAIKREVVQGAAREDVPAAIVAAEDEAARDVQARDVPTKADAAELADANNEKKGISRADQLPVGKPLLFGMTHRRKPFPRMTGRHTLIQTDRRSTRKGGHLMSLSVRTLHITESASLEMERNLWNDLYVPAKMTTNGRTVSVSVRYRGGHTRGYPKRSYEVVRKNQAFHYNAEFDDPSIIRNALSFAFFPMIGVPAPRTKHVLLVVNGQPRGVYLEIEGVERLFFRRRNIGASSLFYAVNDKADFGVYMPDTKRLKTSLLSGYEYRFGDSAEKTRLKSFIQGLNSHKGSQAEAFIKSHLDVNNYLSWLAGAVLTGNYDGFEQNYAIYRSRKTGKLRMIPWDYEGTWGRNCYGRIVDSSLVSVSGYNHLTRKLLENRTFRNQYKAILQRALDGPFTENKLMPIVEQMLSRISPYIREDRSRRFSYGEFLAEPNVFRQYIRERRTIVKAEMNSL
jgi:spore coat protein H